MARTKIFVSYSHKDHDWLERLKVHLAPLEHELDLWDDTRIAAGARWRDDIRDALDAAKVGLLLVSPDFLASPFAMGYEVPALLGAADARGARVLVLHVRAALVEEHADAKTGLRLADFQPLNDPQTPLAMLTKAQRDGALVDIARRIRAAVREEIPPVDPRPYLERLHEQTRWLDVRGIGAKAAERVELLRVYTRLRVAAATEQEMAPGKRRAPDASGEPEREPRDLELRDLLQRHPHLVLVGDPGAGKTTFLRFVALNLARALLGEDTQACLERLGLQGAPPFPILVSLADFGRFLGAEASRACPPRCAEQFQLYLDRQSRGLPAGTPASFLRERVRAGGCVLLLDGLDEVPGQELRERVGAILDEVVAEGRALGNRHVVTCRTRAYQGRTQLGASFTRAVLADFGRKEVEEFVAEWSRTLFRVPPAETEGAEAEAAAKHERELLAAIQAHPHVRPLTANPLLLTILAVVHWNRKKLPEQRADLYDAAVDYLLESRTQQSRYESTLRRDCLMAVARALFEDPQGVRKTLGRAEAAAAVAPLLGLKEAKAAVPFIEDEELHSGILVSRIEGEVEFWHPTFGEYLAALGLAWEPDYWERIGGRLFEERWNEVVLLLAGCRRRLGLRHASDFIGRILSMDASLPALARQVGLVGRILRDILPAGGDPAQGTGYDEARRQVLAIFEQGSDVEEKVRVEVGEALGQAGDPRIADDDHANRVFIEGGAFLMGSAELEGDLYEDERPVHRVTVSGFWIDRYPVTVAQYRRFVEAGAEGYLAARFWRPEGWRLREQHKLTGPRQWEEQLRRLNRPVTYVSWYEADAYCAWLSAKSGLRVSLPTEAQWEYAARGEAGRKYPWGDEEPTARHANFAMHVGEPTPVGIYPLGATSEGVQDLSGNVWEWCQDWYGSYGAGEQRDPAGPAKATYRVRRGGGFGDDPIGCRAAYRNNDDPDDGDDSVGFRCVVLGSGGQLD
jgi:formylglycine-generating enzyme required for sulfatase activity/DNA polymerase III delta prime subunit